MGLRFDVPDKEVTRPGAGCTELTVVLAQVVSMNDNKISGPWKEAIDYAMGQSRNPHYDVIFKPQFVDLSR